MHIIWLFLHLFICDLCYIDFTKLSSVMSSIKRTFLLFEHFIFIQYYIFQLLINCGHVFVLQMAGQVFMCIKRYRFIT